MLYGQNGTTILRYFAMILGIQAQIPQIGLPLLHVELLLTSFPHPLFLVCGQTGRIAQVFQNVVDLHHHFFQFMEPGTAFWFGNICWLLHSLGTNSLPLFSKRRLPVVFQPSIWRAMLVSGKIVLFWVWTQTAFLGVSTSPPNKMANLSKLKWCCPHQAASSSMLQCVDWILFCQAL